MPSESQAQNRWAHWAEKHSSNPKTRKAAADYVAADHGRKISKLPERVGEKKKISKLGFKKRG